MQKVYDFNLSQEMEVSNETIKGVLLGFIPLASDDSVCPISDLNSTRLDLILERPNMDDVVIFAGNLDDLLTALYAQTTKYALSIKPWTDGYKMFIDLSPAALRIGKEDVLRVRIHSDVKTFTGVNVAKSKIVVETVPATGSSRMIPFITAHPVGINSTQYEENLKDNVFKVVIATDYTSAYDTSNKAKVERCVITSDNFKKDVSKNVLLAENSHYLDNNPETDVRHLVAYWSDSMLYQSRIKIDFSDQVDKFAKVLTVGLQAI